MNLTKKPASNQFFSGFYVDWEDFYNMMVDKVDVLSTLIIFFGRIIDCIYQRYNIRLVFCIHIL